MEPTSFQVYKLQYEPSMPDIYVLATEEVDPTTVALLDDAGDALPITFTVGSTRVFGDDENCTYVDTIKKCGGTMTRLLSSKPIPSGHYLINFSGKNTPKEQMYSSVITITALEG